MRPSICQTVFSLYIFWICETLDYLNSKYFIFEWVLVVEQKTDIKKLSKDIEKQFSPQMAFSGQR